ncbi:MAG: 50S ribosomal protein L1 [Deltaproteobacteria bacterium]|nr:50S ribosomal protein L1 [Deltaproteobacteria bacterium]
MKITKKQKDIRSKIDRQKKYSIDEALDLVKQGATRKFDETVDVAIRLGIDPKQSDQQVRSSVVLPHGLGKSVRVLAFAKGPKEAEAKEAGADYLGTEEIIEKIKGGWLDFEAVVATPDMMGVVSKVGKILGPRGLMPNPKLGTVSMDIKKAISDCKAGKAEFRNEKAGILQAPFGKISFGTAKLKENLMALLETVQRLKPQTAKGVYIKGISMSSAMGPGLKIDPAELGKKQS